MRNYSQLISRNVFNAAAPNTFEHLVRGVGNLVAAEKLCSQVHRLKGYFLARQCGSN